MHPIPDVHRGHTCARFAEQIVRSVHVAAVPEVKRSGSAGVVVGLLLRSVRTPCGQSGSLCGLKLVPSKRRCLVPPMLRDGNPLGKNTLGALRGRKPLACSLRNDPKREKMAQRA